MLAEWSAAADIEHLPSGVQLQAKRGILNVLGCALGGSEHPAVTTALQALHAVSSDRDFGIIGRPDRCDMFHASMINTAASSVYTFDDTHAQAIIHPCGPVAMALLAFAEKYPVSGRSFLDAFIIGVEVACRVSKSVSVAPAEAGIAWSQTGTAGGIGAAVAVGRLLKMPADKIEAAMGIAANQACGLRISQGTMTSSMLPGLASSAGLRAALWAHHGFTSTPGSIEGKKGFATGYAETFHAAHLTEGLGERFDLIDLTFKPYPCGVVIHPLIDACLDLKASNAFKPSDIGSIHVRANPWLMTLTNRPHPTHVTQAQVSAQHWVAASLRDGIAGLQQLSDECVFNPDIARLRASIKVESDETMPRDACQIVLRLNDGRDLETAVAHCRGSLSNPMSDRDLEAKFLALACGKIPEPAAARLVEACRELETIPEVSEVVRLARPSWQPAH